MGTNAIRRNLRVHGVGFLSRVRTGSMAANHLIGPGVSLAFVALMVVVDYARPIEFRSPIRHGILVPYLLLFFGAILLMGLPMFRIDRQLWLVTVATTVALLGATIVAMRAGVG